MATAPCMSAVLKQQRVPKSTMCNVLMKVRLKDVTAAPSQVLLTPYYAVKYLHPKCLAVAPDVNTETKGVIVIFIDVCFCSFKLM